LPGLYDPGDGPHGVGRRIVSDLGFQVEVADGYDEAVTRTRLALRAEGFSVITEMHVGGGLLGPEAGDERQYLILGAWSPPTSSRRIGDQLEVAVHLPCNFVVQETGPSAIVATLDPAEELEEAEQATTATEARAALVRVLERVGHP
jgi:uncharacterized protein (DUF302 family)